MAITCMYTNSIASRKKQVRLFFAQKQKEKGLKYSTHKHSYYSLLFLYTFLNYASNHSFIITKPSTSLLCLVNSLTALEQLPSTVLNEPSAFTFDTIPT